MTEQEQNPAASDRSSIEFLDDAGVLGGRHAAVARPWEGADHA
jgi:hypothetical protein